MTPLLAVTLLLGLLLLGLVAWRRVDRQTEKHTWQTLIATGTRPAPIFEEGLIKDLPEAAQRFFRFSIARATPLYTVAEIDMHGEIGLGDKENPKYAPMSAHQVLAPPHGLVWRVKTGPISGSDGATPGTSWTRFWLLGLLPVVRAGGDEDHRRAAFGRVVAEAVFWTPAALLLDRNTQWRAIDNNAFRATMRYEGLEQAVDVTVSDNGQPEQVVIQRWSNANPDKTYRLQPFGGYLSEFKEFQGFLLPTRVEGGNFIGTDGYFPFFKARVDAIRFVAD